jgi:hypothetical protein
MLECRKAIDSRDPLFVSPRGTRIAVGGNGQTTQRVLETNSLKEVGEFAWNEARAIPGDDGILLEKKGKSYLRMSDSSERQLPFINLGVFWPDARFLNDKELAGFVSTDSLAVMRLDGTLLYQKPVTQLWRLNEILPTASGSRFCFHEAGYTTLNSIVNFLDIENTRPFNTQTITVFETESGRPVFRSEWDPRPYVGPLGSPALSPDAHELAVMHDSHLEVYRIP